MALAGVSNLGWLSEAELRGGDRPRHGNHLYGSFGSDFATAGRPAGDGGGADRGPVESPAGRRPGRPRSSRRIETALDADLRQEEERYRHRETIAAILRPWFAARDLDQVSAELDRARVLWGPYRGMADVAAAHRRGAHPVLADVELGRVRQRDPRRHSEPSAGTVDHRPLAAALERRLR